MKKSLRELRSQLSVFNHQISTRLEVKDVDLDCIELVAMHGPISPSSLARRAGLHPATVTGILDRLQHGGWITRERDPVAADRRAVTVRAVRGRNMEAFRLYSAMNTLLDDICAEYSPAELELLVDFLHRATAAGENATAKLIGDEPEPGDRA